MRNPEWTRDELILGLDVYSRLETAQLTDTNSDVIALSRLLNDLPIHPAAVRNQKFRNAAGVSMELRGFLAFDPRYPGRGLRGARIGEEVWNEFSADIPRLRSTADAIRLCFNELRHVTAANGPSHDPSCEDPGSFPEGEILTRLHRLRERNASATRRKKLQVLHDTGRLACEACDFDFLRFYGDLGGGFAECHHLVPLCRLPSRRTTRLADLAIVCANCHRMLHRSKAWLTIADLRHVVISRRPGAAIEIGVGR